MTPLWKPTAPGIWTRTDGFRILPVEGGAGVIMPGRSAPIDTWPTAETAMALVDFYCPEALHNPQANAEPLRQNAAA